VEHFLERLMLGIRPAKEGLPGTKAPAYFVASLATNKKTVLCNLFTRSFNSGNELRHKIFSAFYFYFVPGNAQ